MSFEPSDYLWIARRQSIDPNSTSVEESEISEALRFELETLSIAYEGLDPAGRLTAAQQPGYLTATSKGWRFFVPWPLVTSFPDNDICDSLFELGRNFALQPVDNICLSGSTATAGSKVEIGDIDFCQYMEVPPVELVHNAECFMTAMENRILLQASYGNVQAQPPWPDGWKLLEEAAARAPATHERFLADFVGSVTPFGVLPISTVILTSDFSDRSRAAASESYVYQEAVAVPVGKEAPPWSLVDVSQIGRYLNYLRRQMEKWAEKKPLKAVKRGLSLAHTIKHQVFVSQALDILLSDDAAHYITSRRRRELMDLHDRSSDLQKELLEPLVHTLFTDELEDAVLGSNELLARCRQFLADFKSELEEIDRQLESGGGEN